MLTYKKFFTRVVACGLGALLLTGCEREGSVERAGEQIDKAVESAGDAIEKAGDKIERATDH